MSLNAVEVLYLHYINGKTSKDIDKYDFWELQYSMSGKTLFQQLLKKNVIYENTTLSATLTKLTVVKLKNLLRKSSMKVSGNKKDLIQRIAEHADVIDWKGLNLTGVFLVTDEYKAFYEATSFINYFHFNGTIGIHTAYEYYLQHPQLSPDEVIIEVLNQTVDKGMQETNKYNAVKAHWLLSTFYQDTLHDSVHSMYHLDHFTVLIILEAVIRNPEDELPYMDHYTLDKYREFMRRENLSPLGLYNHLMHHTQALNYPEEYKARAAQIIVDDVTSVVSRNPL
jgi:hypothetical protein